MPLTICMALLQRRFPGKCTAQVARSSSVPASSLIAISTSFPTINSEVYGLVQTMMDEWITPGNDEDAARGECATGLRKSEWAGGSLHEARRKARERIERFFGKRTLRLGGGGARRIVELPLVTYDGNQHGDAADRAPNEADDDLPLCELESVGHHEETEDEECYADDNANGVVLQLSKHRSGSICAVWSLCANP